ncbi:MAG: DNA repair protein RecO [Gammaproteobacteria bacterium]|nr:MAG: DNA repair protein RecO [Gammaproteobacteria bacterium]UTW41882.1 DNA repair protein RecO [bacterium SCSIO 12844]
MLVSDIGYVLYKKKYRESSLLITLFTENHGKINAIVKGYYRKNQKQFSLFESNFLLALQMKEPRSTDGLYTIYKSEIYQLNRYQKLTYIKQMCCYYMNELIYYLYPNSVVEEGLFKAYQITLSDMIKNDQHELSLRIFESSLLNALGYGVEFEVDQHGHPIDGGGFYQLTPMSLPQKVDALSENIQQLIFAGDTLTYCSKFNKVKDLENIKNILQSIKLIHKLYINHLLQGRQLESRRLLLEYMEQLQT